MATAGTVAIDVILRFGSVQHFVGQIHVDLDLRANDDGTATLVLPEGAIERALSSMAENSGLTAAAFCGEEHKPVQHRDGRSPWCETCLRNSAGVHRDDMPRAGQKSPGVRR